MSHRKQKRGLYFTSHSNGLEKSIVTWALLSSLQQVIEVIQALAQLPDGDPDAQLPG